MSDPLSSTKALLAINADGVASHPLPEAAVGCMRWCVSEIERLRRAIDRKQMQYERSQRYWVEAAQKALAGDQEHLRLRIDLAQSGPIEMTEQQLKR